MDILNFLAGGNTYIGFILAALVANLFPLVPEEVFLLGLGYMAGTSSVSFIKIYFFVWVGLLIADTGLYYLSKSGTKFVLSFLKKFISMDYIDKHRDSLSRRMPKIIFISRFIVNVRAIGPILAGATEYPYKKFIKIDMVALAIYILMMLSLGLYFKSTIEKVLSGSGFVGHIITISLLTIVFISTIVSLRKKIGSYLIGEKLQHFLGFFRIRK